jgi:hypothetical protein
MDDIPRCVLPYPMNLTYPPPTMKFHQLPKTLQFLTPLGHLVQHLGAGLPADQTPDPTGWV